MNSSLASGWTAEQVLALAPDASSAKSGRELAAARKWLALGSDGQAAWGECQGSAKEPYQTQIDLAGPAFKCSCPSRKFPCKHGLGLFLLLVSQPGAFKAGQPPAWVSEWLAKRAQVAEKPKEKSADKAAAPEAAAGDAARRAARREERVRAGLEDFERWLEDLVRQGLNSAQAQPGAFWEGPAARLVDAQAPGLGRRVRDLAGLAASGEGWQSRVLAQAGKLYLLVRAYQQLEGLPPAVQADVRTQIGWTQDQEALLQQPGLRDTWLVAGRRIEEDANSRPGKGAVLKVQRTWLMGQSNRKNALVLHFAAPGQVLDASLAPGSQVDAELVFFPGSFPLRALIKNRAAAVSNATSPAGFTRLADAVGAYAERLAANPWLELYPLLLRNVIPQPVADAWMVCDSEGEGLPLADGFKQPWVLAALSGGRALDMFCEWDGASLWPLSVWAEGRFIPLHSFHQEAAA